MRTKWRWAYVVPLVSGILALGTARSSPTHTQGLTPTPDDGGPPVVIFGHAGRGEEIGASQWGHGCWFTPPDPPACSVCADACNTGQKCCLIFSV